MSGTDLELIRRFALPLARKAPLLLRGKVEKAISAMTHQDVRDLYTEAGDEEGIKNVMAAIVRIGKGETIGAP